MYTYIELVLHQLTLIPIFYFIDTARITVSFDEYNMSFSDVNNPIFRSYVWL